MKKLASRQGHSTKVLIALVVAAFLTLSLPACSQPQAEAVPAADTPATLEEVPGTDLHRITLTERAVERLGLKTGMAASGPQGKLTVPYGAILYDSQGRTWVYTNPELRVYVRQAVKCRANRRRSRLAEGRVRRSARWWSRWGPRNCSARNSIRPTEMRWIIGISLKFRTVVVALACAVMLLGSVQLSSASIDVFPEFAPPRVEIQTACLGLTAQEVEELVSVPIEASLSGMPGLDELRSKSVPQLSSIVLVFKQGTDLLNARQLVSERMAAVTSALPTWAAPPVMLQPLSSTSRVMKIGMTSSEPVPDRDVHALLLDDPRPVAPGTRGGQRRHLG